MNQIPSDTQFVGVIPSKDLSTKKSGIASTEAEAYTLAELAESLGAIEGSVDKLFFVSSLLDLPVDVSGVITLEADAAYYFTKEVDLLGARLVGLSNTAILGSSSENSIIKSTGLAPGTAVFSSQYTTPIRHVAFKDVDTAIYINGIDSSVALDWTGVNFVNVPNVGTFDGGGNIIFSKGAFLNSKNMIITGTWATVGFDASLFSGDGSAGDLILLDASCIITRRFRTIYSAVISFGLTTGINVTGSATIPVEGFILETVSFSGGGTYLPGIIGSSLYALFTNCSGIVNSYEISNYYMSGNVSVTDIVSAGVAVKVNGATDSNPLTQKFINTDNRATYSGGITRIFNVTVVLSVTSTSSNDQVGFYVSKNGALLPESEIYVTTNVNSRAENVVIHAITELSTNDYIEVWVENSSDSSDLTVSNMNVQLKSLK
jgi:hypothetical protein